MLDHSPDARATIDQVQGTPIVTILHTLLVSSLQILQEGREDHDVPPLLGAIMPEADSFLADVFAAAYPPSARSVDDDEDDMDVDA